MQTLKPGNNSTSTILLGSTIVFIIVSIIQIIRAIIEIGFRHTLFGLLISLMIGGGIMGIVRVTIIGEIKFQHNKETITTIGGIVGIALYIIYVTLEIGWMR